MHRSLFLIILMGQCRPTSSACQAREYHFVDQKKNWSEAQSYCREIHTDLATINDMEDMEDIKLLKERVVDSVNEPAAWIGLEKTGKRRWHWPKLDIELNETEALWRYGEPNNSGGNENCVVMKPNNTWVDVSCNKKVAFICQNENGTLKPIQENPIGNMTYAQSYCERNHGHLAENFKIHTTTVVVDVRIGLTAFNDPWKWSDGSNASFKHWQTNFKENPGQSRNCAVTNSSKEGKWNARNCSNKLPFFCYSDGCLDGWKKFNGSCYQYFADNLKWSAAEKRCQDLNAHLASIHSQEEQNVINSCACALDLSNLWIGLNDIDSEGMFNWTDGSSLDYENWENQQPGPGNDYKEENCVMIREDKWHDQSCDKKNSFTCKSVPDNLILIKKNMTWFDAVDYCREKHHDLVSIQDASEQEQVRQRAKMADTHHVWLGMHYSCPFDFWFWLSNKDSCYRNWAPGSGTGSCGMAAAVQRGGDQSWDILHHDKKFNFICVRK